MFWPEKVTSLVFCMNAAGKTYLVGRSNSTIPCDISVPATEESVSRKHMELTVTGDGKYYVVHIHPVNKTKVLRGGQWVSITQDFVEEDTPLKLGRYETSARRLLGMLSGGSGLSGEKSAQHDRGGEYVWDPDAGTIVRRGN